MAKKFNPFVLLMMPTPEPTTVTGGGTGQSTTDPYACDFTDWLNLFAVNLNGDDVINEDDYRIWFQNLYSSNPAEGEAMWQACGNTGPLFPSPIVEPIIEPVIEPDPGIEP